MPTELIVNILTYILMGDFNIDTLDNNQASMVSFGFKLFVQTDTNAVPTFRLSQCRLLSPDHFGLEVVISGEQLDKKPNIFQTINDKRQGSPQQFPIKRNCLNSSRTFKIFRNIIIADLPEQSKLSLERQETNGPLRDNWYQDQTVACS